MAGELPAGFAERSPTASSRGDAQGRNGRHAASRSQIALEALAPLLPELLGGSADLTGSNLHQLVHGCAHGARGTGGGNYINYGVREFGMAAIINGMALHGGFIPFGGTFLTFSDYAATRSAWRR